MGTPRTLLDWDSYMLYYPGVEQYKSTAGRTEAGRQLAELTAFRLLMFARAPVLMLVWIMLPL